MQVGSNGYFVRAGDAGEVRNIASHRSLVETLAVALPADINRCIDEYLEELARGKLLPYRLTFRVEGRDECAEHDEPGIPHQLRDLTCPPDRSQ